MTTIAIIDTETTDAGPDAQVISLAVGDLNEQFQWMPQGVFEQFYRPTRPISYGAMAIHGIIPEDLTDAPPVAELPVPQHDYLIGHNVDFDVKCLENSTGKKVPGRRIDTLALDRSLYPQADSHRLAPLLLYLADSGKLYGGDNCPVSLRMARSIVSMAHRAAHDVNICHMVLCAILADTDPAQSVEELWQRSEAARVPVVMPFGKHKGTPIAQVPADYKRWLLGQPDVDVYLRKALLAADRLREQASREQSEVGRQVKAAVKGQVGQ